MFNTLGKIFGTRNDRQIKQYRAVVQKINDREPALQKLSDEELASQTQLLRDKIAAGTPAKDILVDAFAVVREASVRVLGMRHFDVQMVGGMALFEGKIAEMKTGEGKTLTATLPVYLTALEGKGAHVVTVNDYLASRDAQEMGKLYEFLGLTTGLIVHNLSDEERRIAYSCDITYGTNNEFGFDYLRDNMKTELERYCQRGHHFCIVDEVDSILIDEARTPLIISGPAETDTEIYNTVNAAIPGLHKDSDYIVDEKSRTVALTEDGISKLEQRLRVDNLFDPKNINMLHHAQQALKAHIIFRKDVDYVVKNGKIIIVDEFTGRLMDGRRYSDGLHGALEAKEHVKVQHETQVLASITFQNYFRLYSKLSGMTGTADTEAVEFKKIYDLDVVVIPTNKPLVRKDEQDEVYRTAREKFEVIADEIADVQKKGQPILVGTVSVEKSELLAALLNKRQIPHEILNAKNHGREATIIQEAGQKGRVTISTNMAGRGTDIVLGEGVKELGGLYVIATERHESRRIDNQLRGRSGRQGDPGRSKFFLSLEDDLMRIFASDKLSAFMGRLGMEEKEAIVSPMVSRAIERAQKRVEEQNFSSRKHVLEYDDVMNQQRQVVYKRRLAVLKNEAKLDFIDDAITWVSEGIVSKHSPEKNANREWDLRAIEGEARAETSVPVSLNWQNEESEITEAGVVDLLAEQILKHYRDKTASVGEEVLQRVESYVHLVVIDQNWKDHLRSMEQLQDNVRLRGYAQRDPLQEYKKEAFKLFEDMMARIEDETALSLIRMPPPSTDEDDYVHEEVSEDQMTMGQAPLPTSSPEHGTPNGGSNGSGQMSQDDGLIYHGSRSQDEAPRQETVVRDGDKIGRNDACPCGSGKKYKKCHGKPGSAEASL